MKFEFQSPDAKETWQFENGRVSFVKREADITDTLEFNQACRNELDGYTESRELKAAACIPPVVVEELMKQGIWFDPVAFKKWLNNSDNRKFRMSEGRI